MIWFDRDKGAPGDMLLQCAFCGEQKMLTMPLPAHMVLEHLRLFEAEHAHGRRPELKP